MLYDEAKVVEKLVEELNRALDEALMGMPPVQADRARRGWLGKIRRAVADKAPIKEAFERIYLHHCWTDLPPRYLPKRWDLWVAAHAPLNDEIAYTSWAAGTTIRFAWQASIRQGGRLGTRHHPVDTRGRRK